MKNIINILFLKLLIVGGSYAQKPVKVYHENGNVKFSAFTNEEGKYTGEMKLFYENGKIRAIKNYSDGKLVGEAKTYSENGQITLLLNESTGTYKEYYENGQLHIKGTLERKDEEEKRKKIGEWKTYHENGQLRKSGSYVEGVRTGDWKYFDEVGDSVTRPLSYDYFNFFEKKDYLYFIDNHPREALSAISKQGDTKGLNSLQSKCNATYDDNNQTLKNKEHCSSKLWLEDIPAHHGEYSAYEFELNFNLTSEFQQIEKINNEGGWPLQVMLGNSPNGYTWVGVTPKGKLCVGYKNKDGFTDVLTVFKSDRVYMDKPNHLKFVWFPSGIYYVELNFYKRWSFDLALEASQLIPPAGLSNRILFYSDIIIDSMFLNIFEE